MQKLSPYELWFLVVILKFSNGFAKLLKLYEAPCREVKILQANGVVKYLAH